MKKRISLLLLLSIVALLGLFVAPAAYSQPVEGTFDYNYETVYQEEAHGNTILYALEHENWTGSFEGKAHAVFIVFVNEAGAMTVDLFSTFTGTVDDKSGSLVIHLIGDKPSPEEDWFGDWDIVRGTGELVDLRGQGTWGGPGYEGPSPSVPDWDPVGEGNTRPDIWYKGTLSTSDNETFKATPGGRTCSGNLSPEGRWCDNGDGTVTDMTTGLTWLKNATCGGAKTWNDAVLFAGWLHDGWTGDGSGGDCGLSDDSGGPEGYGTWRLPTLTELFGLTHGSEAILSKSPGPFSGVRSVGSWSSTTDAKDPDAAWRVCLTTGDVRNYDKTVTRYVWPVRSGQ